MNYCNPEGFRNEVKKLLEKGDIDAFYNWFDGGETKEGAFEKGADVFDRVIFPLAEKHLPEGHTTALDLGYGAGTKIEPAFKWFDVVYGVDVHEEAQFVSKSISVPNGKKLRLVTGDGTSISLKGNTVDFIYSWVTLCHMGTIENVKKYLGEVHRVLKPGGVAVLFFTRLIRSKSGQLWKEVELDMRKEEEHIDGYREGGPKSAVRSINLVMSMWKMNQLAEEAGFNVIDKTASWDDGPVRKIYHGQYGIVLKKPAPIVATTTQPPEPKKSKTSRKKGSLKRRKAK